VTRSRIRVQQLEPESSPTFTWSPSGDLEAVSYAEGWTKVLEYDVDGNISRVDFTKDGVTYRRDLTYNVDGSLASITDSEVSS